MGKRTIFTPAQNGALRRALLGLGFTSHSAAAEALGIAQQNASRLFSDDRSGFSYLTGSRVAQLSGFEGVDAFFIAKGVLEESCTDVSAVAAKAG
jgi:hypothetical protein